MRLEHLTLVLCTALALSGCATAQEAPRLPPGELVAASACADWRWIGITDSTDTLCPTPDRGWTVKPLVEPAAKDPQCAPDPREASHGKKPEGQQVDNRRRGIATADVVEELERFCVYEASDSRQRPLSPPFLSPQRHGLVRLDRDCAGIAPAAPGDLTPADLEQLSANFFSQAGRPQAMAFGNREGVRLAFLDTEPDGTGVPPLSGSSMHGYTLAHIARRLVCSPQNLESCAAQITTRLALPLLHFDPARLNDGDLDVQKGGGIGTQMDLAVAISREVDDWLVHSRREGAPRHLVLNLSLGWDPKLLGGLDEERIALMQTGTQAVYRALQYAKSLDVLVLAAAGNKRDCCPQSTGPLLPAAWEAGSPVDDRYREASDTPLVYAVGGVGSDGRALSNAREQGMPKRAAYGENGVVTAWDEEAREFSSTWLYTGSSVSTAVVSSAAALVWDSFPGLSAAQVMDALDGGGTPLAMAANFWPGSAASAVGATAPAARRISVCRALRHACGSDSSCPVAHCDEVRNITRGALPPTVQPLSMACHPWLVPQPEDPLCPACGPPLGR